MEKSLEDLEEKQKSINNLFLVLIEYIAESCLMEPKHRKHLLLMIKNMKTLNDFKHEVLHK